MLKKQLSNKVKSDHISIDGLIANVTNAANAQTSYSYFNLLADGFSMFTLDHIITSTTLTIESTNVPVAKNLELQATCSSTDGTGATLVATSLLTSLGFAADEDLNGIMIEITADATTPSNVGQKRICTHYAQASGTITLSSALPGATTSSVTSFKLVDSPQIAGRLVSDPTSALWRDVTSILTGSATHVASGRWIVDVPQQSARFRVKQVTTNATNSCKLILARGR